MINVIIKMRDSGEIVREDTMNKDLLAQHLSFLTYFYGMDDEGWVDKKDMTILFYTIKHPGYADIIIEPAN